MLFEQIKPGSACQWRSRKDIQPFFSCGFIDKSHCTTDQTNFVTDHYTLVVILNGRAEYETADGTVHTLKTGDFFQRIPGIAHTTRIDPDSRYFEGYVVMGALFYEAWKDLGILPFPHPVGHCRNLMEATEQMQSLRERIKHGAPPDAGANALLVQQVILNILADTKRENPNRQLLDKACQYLTADFRKPCDLESFCRKHNVNFHTFRRWFHDYAGVSPHQYRQNRRLDRAASLLETNLYNISETAEILGFSSPYEFSERFKQCFGMAPSRWQKKNCVLNRDFMEKRRFKV